MKNAINPDEAPEGYKAIPPPTPPTHLCEGCAFDGNEPGCRRASCLPAHRDDKRMVIFVPKE